jgi:beta-glucosidase
MRAHQAAVPAIRAAAPEARVGIVLNVSPVQGIDDPARIEYLRDHIEQAEGIADAYFIGSFLDNFEWARGYDMRFGIVHVDYETQWRTVKRSGRWYAERIRRQG